MILQARWVLPIDQPLLDGGWIEVAGGRVVSVGSGRPPGQAEDLGDVVVLPGLVNAHTHLELAWMAGRVPAAGSMIEWIRGVLALRGSPDVTDAEKLAAMRDAAAAMRATGTVVVGDVSNSLAGVPVLQEFGFSGVVFHELIGFNVGDPGALVAHAWDRLDQLAGDRDHPHPIESSVVGHAPYSVAPALLTAIARRQRDAPLSIHLAESAEEIEFLRTGGGPFRALLEEIGAWDPSWTAPGTGPVEYFVRHGYLQPGTIAVHGVHLSTADLSRLRAAGCVVVTCPRSNEWVGGGLPPIVHFYASRIPVAIGTDSLASAPSVNLFDELAALRRLAPEVSAASLLDSATRVGARALGCGREFGAIAHGKRAAFVAVQVPADVKDVKDLVSGVAADAVSLING